MGGSAVTLPNDGSLLELQEQLIQLRIDALALEQQHQAAIACCPPGQQESARNLLHYLSVRQRDVRPLQHSLARYGFSSLSTLEPFTLAHLNAVLALMQAITGRECPAPEPPVDYLSGPQLLRERCRTLLGPIPHLPSAHIMVTMPSADAAPIGLVAQLLQAGMTVMRINCAHDHPAHWQDLIARLQQAKDASGLGCRVQLDLAGPKLRTGPIQSSGRMLKLKPRRDLYGMVLEPCRVWLHSMPDVGVMSGAVPGINRTLQLTPDFLAACRVGDRIHVVDSRGQRRKLHLVQVQEDGCVAELNHTTYLTEDTLLELKRGEHTLASSMPLGLVDVVLPIVLYVGDQLVLTRADLPGVPEQRNACGELVEPARIHCSIEAAFDQVQAGQRVWFDDGSIGAVVEQCDSQLITVRITLADPRGSKLRPEKGINFPDSELPIAALTAKDLLDLELMARQVDIVALSFVRAPEDLLQLHQVLLELDCPSTGIVLKIENRQAFENLPRILLAGLGIGRPLGVMIARGDLAVEVGFERLAELQQEILWLCEAAHIPVIWATQILESMAKKGVPSRAEVTDAGMAVLAECVMLNKGPYIVEAVAMLKNILCRMDQFYLKRRATLRPLRVATL